MSFYKLFILCWSHKKHLNPERAETTKTNICWARFPPLRQHRHRPDKVKIAWKMLVFVVITRATEQNCQFRSMKGANKALFCFVRVSKHDPLQTTKQLHFLLFKHSSSGSISRNVSFSNSVIGKVFEWESNGLCN